MRNGIDNFIRADTTLTEDVVIGPLDSDPAHAGAHPRSEACGFSTSAVQEPVNGLRRRGNAKTDLDPAIRQQQLIKEDEEDRRQHLNHKVARTRIKTALSEFYRSLEMLKNYKVCQLGSKGRRDWARKIKDQSILLFSLLFTRVGAEQHWIRQDHEKV